MSTIPSVRLRVDLKIELCLLDKIDMVSFRFAGELGLLVCGAQDVLHRISRA